MKILIPFLVFSLTLFASEYWSIEQYKALHPEQAKLMQKLENIVQSDAVAVKKPLDTVKIAVLYPGEQLTDYWRRTQKAFEARLDAIGVNYKIKSYFVDENDALTMREMMLRLLSEPNDYLIFTLNIDAHKKMISQLISNQKPKIILQNITTPLKEWGKYQPFMYVGFDHIEGTKLLANYLRTRFKKGSKFLMLYHNEGYVSRMRGDSFIQMTQGYFELQNAFYTYVDKEKAKNIVLRYDAIDTIDFIYNCSTDIAVGASQALKELGKSDSVFSNGWGGGSLELQMIQNKTLDVTVMRINDDSAVAMAEAIRLDLQKQKVPQIYSGTFAIVDSNTDAKKLRILKQKAFRYSGEHE
jgi:autoinducer 2-binding protein LuxP